MPTDVVDALARVPLLSSLDRHQLQKLSADFTERSYDAGSVVVRQGDEQGVGFFIVADGTAIVTVDGKEVAKLGPGSYFGEVALIGDRVRTATVTAESDLHCLVMTAWVFRSFVRGDADVAWKLLEHLGSLMHPTHH